MPAEWRKEILNAAQNLFISKEYGEVMYALGNQMFFKDNPFEAVKRRDDLNTLQKIRSLLALNQSNQNETR